MFSALSTWRSERKGLRNSSADRKIPDPTVVLFVVERRAEPRFLDARKVRATDQPVRRYLESPRFNAVGARGVGIRFVALIGGSRLTA